MPAEVVVKVVYQGADAETSAKTVAGFLAERSVDFANAIVEYGGEVYPPGADLESLALVDGAALDVFKLTAGG
jgi:sulfur carrier protein ThiS